MFFFHGILPVKILGWNEILIPEPKLDPRSDRRWADDPAISITKVEEINTQSNKVADLSPIHFPKQTKPQMVQSAGSKYWWFTIQGQIYNPVKYFFKNHGARNLGSATFPGEKNCVTPLKTNKFPPENWWFGRWFISFFGNDPSSGSTFVNFWGSRFIIEMIRT